LTFLLVFLFLFSGCGVEAPAKIKQINYLKDEGSSRPDREKDKDSKPDMSILSKSGRIIGPGDGQFRIDQSWEKEAQVMKVVESFDDVVERIQSVICSDQQNKSVLLVGEPSDTYRLIFARIAAKTAAEQCPLLWHVDININKIEAGGRYRGDVEEYWENKVIAPASNKDVVLYFTNLGGLIGLGSHSNKPTGVETSYAENISSGRIRSVAFINKYEYNQVIQSENAYVLNSFQEKIQIKNLPNEKVNELLQTYLSVLHPNLNLPEAVAQYLIRTTSYYRPNQLEPQRSLSVLLSLIRTAPKPSFVEIDNNIESEHPYATNSNAEFLLDFPSLKNISIEFEKLDIESTYDLLLVLDANDNDRELERISGNLGKYKTTSYPTNKIKLQLKSDNTTNKWGFKIKKVKGTSANEDGHTFNMDEVRKAILEIVQVPEWIINKDFSVIKELPAKLDQEVVGCHEAKVALVKQVKVGYVSGRTDEKPIGTLLFVGPTGVGKSFIPKKLSEFMGLKLITLDMTSYATPESFDRFLEVMANYLILYPYAIYLFEEIDKADRGVLDRLYFLMDEGIFYDKYQRPLFARGVLALMTTNTANRVIVDHQDDPNLRQLVTEALQEVYRPSFLNRFDAVPIFLPFSDEEFRVLANIMVSKKQQKLKDFYQWNLEVDAATIEFLAINGRSDEYGARPMERLIENVISIGIADFQLEFGALPYGSTISIAKTRSSNVSFQISSEAHQLPYEVDLENNSGKLNLFSEINQLLAQTRMYLK